LPPEPGPERRVLVAIGSQHLDRDVALQAQVTTAVHHRRGAPPDLVPDLVPARHPILSAESRSPVRRPVNGDLDR
jgi:hypothetical protein